MATKPQPLAPDSEIRRRALNPTQSFWVQAPAGSGKTELLIQRYLTLLSRVAEPESILAITFTIKAAGEMRARVIEALQDAATKERPDDAHKAFTWDLALAVLTHDREQGWNLLENAARLRIETIDAACLSIARQMPITSGFGGQPEIDIASEYFYQRAAEATVRALEEDSPIGRAVALILHHTGNKLDILAGLIAAMLAKREQWRSLVESGLSHENAIVQLEEALAESGCVQTSYNASERERIEALLPILQRALQELDADFRRQGRVDFTEVSLAAQRALGSLDLPTDLALSLGNKIEHLLIDEMQDTSRTHLNVIRGLVNGWEAADDPTMPRTLFLVGDPKQSIYRFREGDVGIALELEAGASELPVALETLQLDSNFRSGRPIVEWVNTAFAGIFAAEQDAEKGAVRHAHSRPTKDGPGSSVNLHARINATPTDIALLVADLAEQALERGDHTAILVRARSHLSAIIPELKRRATANPRLRFRSQDIDEVLERPSIQDLSALTRALLHPADSTAWFACLRAPWCGLTLADLMPLKITRDTTLIELLTRFQTEAWPGISSDGAKRLNRTVPILLESLARARRTRLRPLVEDCWKALGGPATLLSNESPADIEVFFDLIDSLDQGGTLPSFAALTARLKRLYAHPDPGAADKGLELMTIHAAKGLEFDTVIIPNLESRSKRDDPALIEWTTVGSRTIISPIKSDWDGKGESSIREFVHDIERERAREESKRLLYVATTRAKKHLHLIANLAFNAKKGELKKAEAGTFLHSLWPLYAARFQHQQSAPNAAPPLPSAQSAFDFELQRPFRRLTLSFNPPPLSQAPPAAAHAITYRWAGETPRLIGKLVHAWLHRLTFAPAPKRDSWLHSIRHALEHSGVPAAQLKSGAERTLAAIEATLDDPRGKWILDRRGSPAEAIDQREYPITGLLNGDIVNGIVDCTFVDQGTRWIIDFKTSFHEGADLDAFLDNERVRYEAQLNRYAALLKNLGPEPIKLGLYFPLLQAWREWDDEG